MKPIDVDAKIGRRMRYLRKAAGMNQSELAGKIGVSQVQVSYYERSHNKVPASIIYLAARAIGCDPGEFFSW